MGKNHEGTLMATPLVNKIARGYLRALQLTSISQRSERRQGDLPETLAHADRAEATLQALGERTASGSENFVRTTPPGGLLPWLRGSVALMSAADPDALDGLPLAIANSLAVGGEQYAVFLLLLFGTHQHVAGDDSAAKATFEAIAAQARSLGIDSLASEATFWLADIARAQGDTSGAIAMLDESDLLSRS
jgi:hypothetical protein